MKMMLRSVIGHLGPRSAHPAIPRLFSSLAIFAFKRGRHRNVLRRRDRRDRRERRPRDPVGELALRGGVRELEDKLKLRFLVAALVGAGGSCCGGGGAADAARRQLDAHLNPVGQKFDRVLLELEALRADFQLHVCQGAYRALVLPRKTRTSLFLH